MKKVKIDAGVCGFKITVTAISEDGQEAKVAVQSDCEHITKMMNTLGDTFDGFSLCLTRPGTGALYEYSIGNFPGHAACPVIAGITKCVEAECNLALPRDASITFVEEG